MPAQDEELTRLARERGLLTESQVEELRTELTTESSGGGSGGTRPTRRLADLAVEKGMLTQGQADEVIQALLPRNAPRQLGRYKVLQLLGKGGMGAVYRGRDPNLKRLVAIKTLRSELAANDDFIARFRREAQLAAQFRSPHVVHVYDQGREGTVEYIVMDFVEGEDLADVLAREGKLEEKRACAICADVVRALQEAQKHSIIHRDIKPQNIMLEAEDGTVKLADLGIGKQVTAAGDSEDSKQLSLTVGAIGTPPYMSPEQAMGETDVDFRSDIFSLGATLFHLVCGRLAYEGKTPQMIMMKVAHDPPPDPCAANRDLSRGMVSVIRKMMAKDVAHRYQSLDALLSDLENVAQGIPRTVVAEEPAPVQEQEPQPHRPTTRPLPAPPPRRGWQMAAVVAVVLVLAGGALAWYLSRREPTVTSAKPRTSRDTLRKAEEVHERVPQAARPGPATLANEAGGPLAPGPPSGWTFKKKTVTVATPEGDIEKQITYYTNTIGMVFVGIPAGDFMMGSENGYDDEKPVHRVSISNSFYIGAQEVTNGQYQRFVAEAGYDGSGDADGDYLRHHRDWSNYSSPERDYPVVCVSWKNARKFCEWLSKKEGVTYRLPTEAEWEYACRAGSATRYYWGDEARDDCAWHLSNNGRRTHPVGQKQPNAFGLCDMSGNVWEWCQSLHKPYPYRPDDVRENLHSGGTRVRRGGSCFNSDIRSANRNFDFPRYATYTAYHLGFRTVVSLPGVRSAPQPARRSEAADVRPAKMEVKADGQVGPGLPAWAKVSQAQIEAAKRDGVPVAKEIDLGDGVTLKMVYIPAGEFLMGSPPGEEGRYEDEGPQHRVTLTRGFFMGIDEITQAQWQTVMRSDPARFKGDDRPVEQVNWYDCQNFIKKLNAGAMGPFRLPTEAEWEYACRAGATTPFHFGETISTDQANYNGQQPYGNGRKGIRRGSTTPAGTFPPNAWGLYDMHGNVNEWCQDWYGEDYYASSPAADPQGPEAGTSRVLRDGAWNSPPRDCRSAGRGRWPPDGRVVSFGELGFRVASSAPTGTAQAQPPEDWTAERKTVKVATPKGDVDKEITYYTNSVGMRFVLIPAGQFMMGSPPGEKNRGDDEGPVHPVRITQAFYMGAGEVTQEQYEKVTGQSSSHFKGPGRPEESVSWNEAQTFCKKLSEKEGVTCRLPTEAEWEYACRAGTSTPYYWGGEVRDDCAWYGGNSENATHLVGLKLPNAFGLFDMSGNVWEWCQSAYRKYPYRVEDGREDVRGLEESPSRVIRGGGFKNDGGIRSASRHFDITAPSVLYGWTRPSPGAPRLRSMYVGFRVAVLPPKAPLAPPTRARPGVSRVVASKEPESPSAPAPKITLPRGWTAESKVVKVATPQGDVQKEISYYTNTVGMKFVLVHQGEFMMGSENGGTDEKPVHRVRIECPFYMGAHEVTNSQWKQFIGANPRYEAKADSDGDYGKYIDSAGWNGDTQPMVYVSWKNAQKFCEWLSTKEGVTYRLPTEAEWEYACRAGSRTKYYWGDQVRDDCAWYNSNSGSNTHPVGEKLPNAFGLYDMSGNVWEWCQSLYKYPYRGDDGREDLRAAGSRVVRGGSWRYLGSGIRSASRYVNAPSRTVDVSGFRVVVSLPGAL